ncbi:LemA family protein [Schleiferiaceae bacterium]|jgi:LemA protein|nr:LemA family protein [Schleiferiaceae bacterium]MDB2572622.1 LemA family protein [Schleiferiaceae bacterium]MDB2581244.1 LemA family protein [Schleiferiaceae bacterium]MDB2597314.1 LemA family protein [Schleiferiaceae bacterium]MDC3252491.1 LemA family protein [Schleiferiaceae bacterium]
MKKSTITLLVVVGILVALASWVIGAYNGLVTLDEETNGKWAQVESAYQRRADLIPNLVNTVKGYAEFEQETLTGVIEARAKATGINVDANNLSPEAIANFQAAQSQLSGSLSRLLVTVERYPDLKANQNFLGLQSQLEGTENRIKIERDRFNVSVKEFNATIRKFPKTIVASSFGFEKKGYFEADTGSEQAPEVQF